jgi:hypothetical protein
VLEWIRIYVRHTHKNTGVSYVLTYEVLCIEDFLRVLRERDEMRGVKVELATEQEYVQANAT